jgi:hypothetical protein
MFDQILAFADGHPINVVDPEVLSELADGATGRDES